MMAERLANETDPDARDKIEMELEKIKGEIEDIEDKIQILRQRLAPSREA
jgi:predicted  nucleic acid-binding Zn-ribbon protein